jgi:hypothetical protein
LKCSDARAFLSQIAEKQSDLHPSAVSPEDLDYLKANGCISTMSETDYAQATSEVAQLDRISQQLAQEKAAGAEAERVLVEDQKKTRSVFFGFHGEQYRQAAKQKLEADQDVLRKEEAPISEEEARISEYLQRKSSLDQYIAFGDGYVALTGSGILLLNSLNAGGSRISDMDLSSYMEESKATDAELQGIASRASQFVVDKAHLSFPAQTN